MVPEAATAPRVVGRYKLYGEIGGGGMATVHVARMAGSAGFGRIVAVKRMHRDYARDPAFAEMFVDEARVAARVHHPNVVQTLDVVSDQGELFLVMELIHGVALTRLLRVGAIPPRVACSIACGMLHGLHAAHEASDENGTHLELVHRDVSPQNVLVGADGIARVLDFGIAKATGRQHATKDGVIKGKCAYMAPEQITNVRVNRQCDVFAASIVLWEALTGERLFRAETERDTLARVMVLPIPLPSSKNPAITPELDAIVMRGLERDLDKRYATARDMARELERLAMAAQSEVGEWVAAIAEDDLAARSRVIAAIERGSASLPDVNDVHSGVRESVATVRDGPRTQREETQLSSAAELDAPSMKKRPLGAWAAGGLVAVAALGGGMYAISRAITRAQPTTATVTPQAPQASAKPPAEAPTTVFEIFEAPNATASPTQTGAPVRTARVQPPPTPSASASAKVDCTSPSYVGTDGRVHYKLECLK
jgi:serine/threonine protein kinase